MRTRASSFKWEYPLLYLRSSSSFLRLLLLRLLITSIYPFTFPSITCFRRQFLRKMWPIQLAFRFLTSRRIFFCSLTLSNTSCLELRDINSHLWVLYLQCTHNDWRSNTTKFYRTFCVFRCFLEESCHLSLNITTLLIVVMDMECVFWEERVWLLKCFDWVHTSCRILLRTAGEKSQFDTVFFRREY